MKTELATADSLDLAAAVFSGLPTGGVVVFVAILAAWAAANILFRSI